MQARVQHSIDRDLTNSALFRTVPPARSRSVRRHRVAGERHDQSRYDLRDVPPESLSTIDLQLRQLARREAVERVALGRVAEVFVRADLHHTLGFARLGDYVRERLGISASQLYEHARVARELRRLPLVAAAFARGELGWTKVRELAGAATLETQRGWLALARLYTADGLKLAVGHIKREARTNGAALSNSELWSLRHAAARGELLPALSTEQSLSDDEIDGESAAQFRIRCPRRVRRQWYRLLALARKVAGAELADWQAAEAVAAESLSSTGWPALAAGVEPRDAPRSSVAAPARQSDGDDLDLLELQTSFDSSGRDTDLGNLDAMRLRLAVNVAMRTGFPSGSTDRVMLASAHELDARMRAILSSIARLDWQIGRRLRVCFDLRLYAQLGYGSEASYVRNRLGMCVRKARGLVALARASSRSAPALGRAYREGRLSWIRCSILLRVIGERNAVAWIQRASQVTVRRLGDEVDWALDKEGDAAERGTVLPPSIGASLAPESCSSCGAEHAVVPSAAAVQIRGHASDVDSTPCGCPANDRADSEICLHGPVGVVALLHAAIAAATQPGEPRWRSFERVLSHVQEHWESAPKHRDPIFERDGWRCAAPACSSRRNLQDHHIVFRSRGGADTHDNRITLCAWHHLRGIHGGRVRVSGSASPGNSLHWELGVCPDGPPLIKTIGDAYV